MSEFVTEAFTLLAIGITTIAIRTYARFSSVRLQGFKPDDYIMIVAGIVYSLETVTAWSVGALSHGLANNGMTDEERTSLVVDSPEWTLRVQGSKTQLIGWSLYTLLLWLLKFCMCIFYERLTEGVDNMKSRVRVGYGILLATYLATELSILLGCQPFKHNWQINPNPGNHCQPAISKIDLYVTVVLNVITDLYLMSIPLPMMWRANIPIRRKALLIAMFSGGVFVMTAGILRCILIIKDPVGGAQQAGSWAVRETFVAVIIGNIPMIYPVARRAMRTISESATFRSLSNSQQANSRADHAGDFHNTPGGSLDPQRKKFGGGRSMHPLTTMGGQTMSGSEEYIVQPEKSPETSPDRHSERSSKDGIYVVTETIVQAREREDGEICPKLSTHLQAERPTQISSGPVRKNYL